VPVAKYFQTNTWKGSLQYSLALLAPLLLSSHQAIKPSSHQAIIKPSPSHHQAIIKPSSSHHQAIIKPSSHQAIKPSSHQAIKPSIHQAINPSPIHHG
jgi:hypothetical protein